MNLTPYSKFTTPQAKDNCNTWNVFVNGKFIEKVTFTKAYSAKDVCKYLIENEGYPASITAFR